MQDQHSQEQHHNEQHHHIPSSPVEQLKAAVNLAETMPPSKIRKNLIGLIHLAPQIQDNLMEKIDLPLQIDTSDPHNPFLKTEFNRDGDSYRSCINNQYYPANEGYTPSPQFRRIQQLGNILFGEYIKLYYGGSTIGNFYVTEGNNSSQFSCGFFAKKDTDQNNHGFTGSWDSFNIADVKIVDDQATIKLNTTIMIEMNINSDKQGAVDLTGFLKKQKTEKRKLGKEKLEEVVVGFGEMVEEQQTVMRQHLEAVYIGKTQEVIFSTRLEYTVQYENQRKSLAQGLRQIHLQS